MSDNEEGYEDGGGGGGADEGEEAGSHDPDSGIFENGFEDADYWQIQQQQAYVAKRRNMKRARNSETAVAAVAAAAAQKHNKMEADQLFPWNTNYPQDPRIMSVDYVVIDSVTYYCSVSLWALLYRQAKTGQSIM